MPGKKRSLKERFENLQKTYNDLVKDLDGVLDKVPMMRGRTESETEYADRLQKYAGNLEGALKDLPEIDDALIDLSPELDSYIEDNKSNKFKKKQVKIVTKIKRDLNDLIDEIHEKKIAVSELLKPCGFHRAKFWRHLRQ